MSTSVREVLSKFGINDCNTSGRIKFNKSVLEAFNISKINLPKKY